MILNCLRGTECKEQAHGSPDGGRSETDGSRRKAEDVAREPGISKHTLYAWKAKYGGIEVSEVQEAKPLRQDNTRLKQLAAATRRSFKADQSFAVRSEESGSDCASIFALGDSG